VTMTVMTTAPSAHTTGQAVRLAGFSLPAILVIAALSQNKRRGLYLFALALMMGFVFNGCGGGVDGSDTGGGGASPGTPAGTATLTVTAVSNSQSAQTTLILSVR
jgi:hypothetical protein